MIRTFPRWGPSRSWPALLVLAAAVWSGGGRDSAAQDGAPHVMTSAEVSARVPFPVLRIPFMADPPVLDGKMDPGEWEDSAAYTAFWQDYSFNTFLHLATAEKMAVFWIAYDRDYLYFAHRSPVFPRGAWLIGKGKYKDVVKHPEYGVLWDDHVEFQLMPTAAERGATFKWIFNSIHTPVDYYIPRQRNAAADMGFESGFELEGQWDERQWVTEMRIPLASVQYGEYGGADEQGRPRVPVPVPDGTVWRHWGARAIGGVGGWTRLFSATTPGGWSANSLRLVFDSAGVSAQVESLGRLYRDSLDLSIRLKNHGERSETVRVGFFIENDQELIFANEDEEFVELLPGETRQVRVRKDRLGITPLGNAVWVDIRTLSGKLVQRSILTSFHHVDGLPGFKEHFVDGMKFSREPRKPFEFRFAYYASVNKLRARIDTDVFGVSDAVRGAAEAKVVLLTDEGDVVRETTVPLEPPVSHPDARTFGGRVGEGVMAFEKLEPGFYKTRCLLYDADRRVVSDQESIAFEQRGFPWEGNTEGLGDIVPAPYRPLEYKAASRRVDTLLHRFTLDSSGLPAQIVVGDPDRNPNWGPQLRAPIRLEATAGGRRHEWEATAEPAEARTWRSERTFECAGRAGPVRLRSRVQYDFDGFMLYDVDYSAQESIETLELVMEIAGPIDLLVHHEASLIGHDEVEIDALRREPGVIWNSRDDAAPKELFYGNFMPWILLGNGDRAFVWVCETDRGMKLLDANKAMQVEKNEAGEITLRVFLVNEPGPVPEERHVQFGLATLPTKPHPRGHRATNWEPEPLGGGPHVADGTKVSIHMNHEEDYARFQPKPIRPRPYTQAVGLCWDMPSVKSLTYTGEFMGRTDVQPNPNLRGDNPAHPVTGRPNDTIFLNSDGAWVWGPSQVDCAVHWRSKQIRLGQVQGFWWDLGLFHSISTDPVIGLAYRLPEHKTHAGGRLQYGFHFFLPRQFFKRLARIHHESGVAATSAHYGGFDSAMAVCYLRDQVHWEASASYSGRFPHMDVWPVSVMRYYALNYSGLNGYVIHDVEYNGNNYLPGCDPVYDRSVMGSALLHDVGSYLRRHANKYVWHRVKNALDDFGFFEEGDAVEFVPYWRSDALCQYGIGVAEETDAFITGEERDTAEQLDEILCTVYRRPERALLVVANPTPTPVSENLVVTPALLGRPVKHCRDAEVGEDIPFLKDPKNDKPVAGTFVPLFVDRYQFRLLQVE